MPDKIYVTYSHVVSSAVPFFHATIHYEQTDSAGQVLSHQTIEAAPENMNMSFGDKVNGTVEEFLVPDFGPSRFGHIQGTANLAAPLSKPDSPYETVAIGPDLSSNWSSMLQFVTTFNDAGYSYQGIHQNSNTFVSAALAAGGVSAAHGVATDPLIGTTVIYAVPGLNESLHAPIGFGLSWTPPDGVQFSSVTESDGSNTYTAELQPGHSGEVTKASVHVTADDVIDKITTDAVDGTRKLTDYDLSGAEPWSSRVIDYNVNGNMTDVTYYNHDQTKDVVTMDAAGAYIWASHQDH